MMASDKKGESFLPGIEFQANHGYSSLVLAKGDALTESNNNAFNRREFIHGALAGAAFAALPVAAFPADNPDLQSVLSQIPKMHDENVKRLQNWIALPSIAAENRNYPQGPDYMAQLARALWMPARQPP